MGALAPFIYLVSTIMPLLQAYLKKMFLKFAWAAEQTIDLFVVFHFKVQTNFNFLHF